MGKIGFPTKKGLGFGLVLLAGCTPTLQDDAANVDIPRVIAVRAEPPEANPGDPVALTALFTTGTTVSWSLCSERKPLADNSPIAMDCLTSAAARVALGAGPAASAKIPKDACRTFGPDPPETGSGRPVDPDETGGYYQPGLATDAVFSLRLICGLEGATQAQTADFKSRYQVNANPDFASVTVNGAAVTDTVTAKAGTKLDFVVSWPASAAESYIAFDVTSHTIQNRREYIRVSWLSTVSAFAESRTSVEENDPATSSSNTITAAGNGTIYLVLRDSRGGTAYRTLNLISD